MNFDQRLKQLSDAAATIVPQIKRGIEKESLRISGDGHLSQRRHPPALGSALTHPYITTDYSEALLELVTPTFCTVTDLLQHLEELHTIVYHHIDDELLWVNSLPCLLSDENSIPIAEFGTSNVGKMKNVYRRGLGLRYGRKMQVIAGLHYNFSVPDTFWDALGVVSTDADFYAVSNAYMAGTRNFLHHGWLLFYLFGASPAACRSFFSGTNPENLTKFGTHTLYGEFATSLRMSNFGYRNPVQSEIRINHNSVKDYIETLAQVINQPFPLYEQYGTKVNGDYLQLNANLLQIENEYYSVIRPKRRILPQEKPTAALKRKGVEYLEVRCLDLDPFSAIGISAPQARFMDLFLTFCLLNPVAPMTEAQQAIITANKDEVVLNGRKPGLKLRQNGKMVPLTKWGLELFLKLEDIASLFDSTLGGDQYRQALSEQRMKLEDPNQTPSAKIVAQLLDSNEPFFTLAMHMAEHTKQATRHHQLSQRIINQYSNIAIQSIEEQETIENTDTIDFDTFLAQYFAQ